MSREQVVTEAIVLTSADVRDDRIVHLLTQTHGRQPVVARHARKSVKRFGGQLQPMTRIEATLTLHSDRELGRLNGSRELEGYRQLKGALDRFGYGSVMLEVVTHLVPPHGHEPGVYELLGRALRHLDTVTEATEDVLALFELRMLRGLGILPALDAFPGLTPEVIEVLEGWLEDRWAPLPKGTMAATTAALEGLIQSTSGRRLRSREVLEELLGR